MKIFKRSRNLKNKLILYFSVTIIVLSAAINIFYYTNTKESIRQNMKDNAQSNIAYITDNIEKQLKLAGQLSDWIFMNRTLEKLLSREHMDVEEAYNSEIKAVINLLDDQIMNSAVGSYVSSLLIESNNGFDLRTGYDASTIDKEDIQDTSWFKDGMEGHGKVYWSSIIENPAELKTDKYIFPLVRPVFHTLYFDQIGWCMVGFKETLISDAFRNFNTGKNNIIYVIDSSGLCISHQDPSKIGNRFSGQEHIRRILKQGSGYFNSKIGDENRLVVFNRFKMTDWTIVEEMSYESLNQQNMMLLNMTLLVLGVSILIAFALTVFLSSNLTNPLRKLLNQMRKISAGNFEREASIEGAGEIGELGKGINEMASNIKELLDLTIKEEDEKRQLELKLLQSQVNPHFLYNTLNSIKWMATVQKAEGIRDAVTALGRLLNNVAKGTTDKITLTEELSLVEDYVFIQNIRYGGRIKLEKNVENRDLLECRIVKFTLQPIVENAIFHGIEPKKDAGRIIININSDRGVLIVSIEDDGIGISEQKIRDMFTNPDSSKDKGFSGMGVKNVDDRIKLTYGKAYGLEITSEVGSFTMVRIMIPIEKE